MTQDIRIREHFDVLAVGQDVGGEESRARGNSSVRIGPAVVTSLTGFHARLVTGGCAGYNQMEAKPLLEAYQW